MERALDYQKNKLELINPNPAATKEGTSWGKFPSRALEAVRQQSHVPRGIH